MIFFYHQFWDTLYIVDGGRGGLIERHDNLSVADENYSILVSHNHNKQRERSKISVPWVLLAEITLFL